MNQITYTLPDTGHINEVLKGVVDRVTFHNPDNGWSILKVLPFDRPGTRETVVVHQTKVFAGATMEFEGEWTVHPKFGRQFKAVHASEQKPATASALEKYLGSGLIKGVGPKTAKKIVGYFKDQTLDVFESDIDRLVEVPGIAHKKLEMISTAWAEHRAIRDVMMFLQSHGISTLFSVRIYKEYGQDAIAWITQDPYRLASDFFGIGFFTADKVALSIGLGTDSPPRITAGIRHVLSAAREFGHCYLTFPQIKEQVKELLELDLSQQLETLLAGMEAQRLLMRRDLLDGNGQPVACYYARSLYFDEAYVAKRLSDPGAGRTFDQARIDRWVTLYCQRCQMQLSVEQTAAVKGVVQQQFSVFTGGPGCGKTTATRVMVRLLEAMGLKVMLAAPTGRAAHRMSEVIGKPAKTIHRLLGWKAGGFKRNESSPIKTDFLVVDECSMLDINLTASLLKAVPKLSQVVFIGDCDQLPSVGAGNVLKDIIASQAVPCFRLTQVFRQAQSSMIIKFAHQINRGRMPWIKSPFKYPSIWQDGTDCLFIDSDEATKEQIAFVSRVKRLYMNDVDPETSNSGGVQEGLAPGDARDNDHGDLYEFRVAESCSPWETEIAIPKKFAHVDLVRLAGTENRVEELMEVVGKVHPWSSLHYGLSALDAVKKLYLEWIPKYLGKNTEIQILSPMTRGSLGTLSLNREIQDIHNPMGAGKAQLTVGRRVFRTGDRVIHRKNNYDLGVFNGDIGIIDRINTMDISCTVRFLPDNRLVDYQQTDIMELDLAYAITIHKSQGSEFEVVIIPVLTQHFKMLFRNLIYTGITRARKLAVFVGTRRALGMAVGNQDISRRQTALQALLSKEVNV
ncbi:SF1B family DNA helicase RecD2 [Desulfobacter postgatei]|uniref:ATP-dependent exoDNAse (Exonuclease V), alpha subunit/helicase superfamily I member n=1 Tax=Desulfobacter postgatei 2ac9 TaxID=879212 RepID=I5B2Z4_9BACT|nr:AAA family ATPase [Desulfobacter postgatei]EIM63857.1 ATP-dependent exoDNAse (exonuclease V), alpha subunit/helicase superfamily I member [Desulfobacter postgatei 2ac9]